MPYKTDQFFLLMITFGQVFGINLGSQLSSQEKFSKEQ
jgi:hypothetical protein